ncbi:MAG TPA: ETC complex I subunit [Pedomonas sp.]|uniref:ETC complex I subunit n=1 Tax=Pedomonas sp. TaxID=2976421 RepID=UPI002F417D25
MTARIYKPSKNAMQSGKAKTQDWVLEFEQSDKKRPDALMGWAGSQDTQSQVRLRFPTQEAAIAYATRYGIEFVVVPEQPRMLKLQAYADNFR